MNTKKKKLLFITGIIFLFLTAMISYRIYSNVNANKERAARAGQSKGVAVEVATVSRRDITPLMTFSANLEPTWSADISAKADGRIDTLNVDEGDYVKAGSVLAILDINELTAQVIQAEGNLYSNQATLEQAELDLSRTQALAKQGAISTQALDTARTKRDLAIGQVRAAEGNLALLQARYANANIIAPKNSIVLKRYVQAGVYTKAGTPILNLGDVSSLLAKAIIAEGQINDISVGKSVVITISALGNKAFTGTISRISPSATLPARTFTVEISIPNPQGDLKAGLFAKVDIPAAVHKNVLAVPESALVSREDQKTVFVVNKNNKAEQRLLKLGAISGGWVEILEGLHDGDTVVVGGQNKIKDGSFVQLSTTKEGAQ